MFSRNEERHVQKYIGASEEPLDDSRFGKIKVSSQSVHCLLFQRGRKKTPWSPRQCPELRQLLIVFAEIELPLPHHVRLFHDQPHQPLAVSIHVPFTHVTYAWVRTGYTKKHTA